jgi:hypothetical protein
MDYFLSAHASRVVMERSIQPDWIDRCLRVPAKVQPDPVDPTLLHHLLVIEENDRRVLRVVYNPTVVPARVITAFFDRRMKDKL